MRTLYSPLSLRTRFLSSRDPVEVKRVTLPSYSAVALVFVSIITFSPNFHSTNVNGCSGGVCVVLNITVPPNVALRGPSGNTPAPLVKPGTHSYSSEKHSYNLSVLQNEALGQSIFNHNHNYIKPLANQLRWGIQVVKKKKKSHQGSSLVHHMMKTSFISQKENVDHNNRQLILF